MLAITIAPDVLRQRLAEAANYAVLQRIAPALHHDVAGLMQPVSILTAVLQKRMQLPEPNLQDIAKNLSSVSNMAKEATTGCVIAVGWINTSENRCVNLHNSVDQATQLLSMELSAAGLKVDNDIANQDRSVPQIYFRSVVVGALLAFCDQSTTGGTLRLKIQAQPKDTNKPDQLLLSIVHGNTNRVSSHADVIRKSRCIDWADVQAMADWLSVTMVQGDGWVAMDIASPDS